MTENIYQDSITNLKELFKQTKNVDYLLQLIKIYEYTKDYKSIVKVRKKIEKIQNTLENIKYLAYYSLILGKYEEALKYYLQVRECEGNTAENNFSVGCCYYLLNLKEQAAEYYKCALSVDPNHVQTLNNLSVIYYECGDWQSAMNLLKRALVLNPYNAETFHHLGIVFRDYIKDYELSELHLRKAIYYDEPHAENYYQLALTYLATNEYQKALENAKKCLDRNKKNKKAKQLYKEIKKMSKTKK